METKLERDKRGETLGNDPPGSSIWLELKPKSHCDPADFDI